MCVRVISLSGFVAIAAALAGCSSDTGQRAYVARAEPTVVSARPEVRSVSGSDTSLMMVYLPEPAGTIRNMREKTFANGLTQVAILENDKSGMGENRLEISAETSPARGGIGQLSIGRPTQAGIRREILARYPQIDMHIVTQPRRNSLGVFGLAIGRASNGARCLFAWQWVDDMQRPGEAPTYRFGSGHATPASLRVQLCRKDATADELAATVEGLTVAPPGVVAQALDPSRRAEAMVVSTRGSEARNASTTIADGSLEGALGPEKRIAVASAPRARSRQIAKRHMPVNQVIVEKSTQPAQPVQQAYSGGARYMAPVTDTQATGSVGGYQSGPVAAVPTRGLDQSLPSAAYRGPSGVAAR